MAKNKEKKAGKRMKKKELVSVLMDFFHSKPDEVLSLKYIFEQLHLTTHPLKMLCRDILSDMLLDDYITEIEKSKYKLNNHGVEWWVLSNVKATERTLSFPKVAVIRYSLPNVTRHTL